MKLNQVWTPKDNDVPPIKIVCMLGDLVAVERRQNHWLVGETKEIIWWKKEWIEQKYTHKTLEEQQ